MAVAGRHRERPRQQRHIRSSHVYPSHGHDARRGRPTRPAHGRGSAIAAALRQPHRRRRPHRAAGLDAGGLPADAGAPDQPARAQRDRRHAARGQLDLARADPQAQGHPDRQGAGRGRPRPLPVLGRRNPRHQPRPAARRPAFRQGQVQLDLQLPDPDLGRRRRHRLAGRRR